MAAVTDQFWTDLKVNMTPDTVQVRTSSTLNNYGERTFTGSAATYDAYIRQISETERTASTDGAIADWVVYIPSDTVTLEIDDELTLPAPVSAIRPVVRVDIKKDPGGQVGVIAFVGQKSKQG